MSLAASLELRVLQGLHQGAQVPLAAFTQGLDIGAAGQADVLLRDAPGQARLAVTGEGLQWQEDDFSRDLQPGMAWRWGSVVLGLALPQAPWPTQLPALAFDRSRTSAEPPAPAGQPQAYEVETGADPAADDGAAAPFDAPERVQRPQARRPDAARWTAARTAGVLAVVLAASLLLLGLASRLVAPPVAATPLTAPAAALPAVDMRQVRQLLVDLGAEMVVLPRLRPDGRLVLKGVVADDDQLEALAVGLRKITGNASVLVITQAEFVARVKTLQHNLPEGIRAQAQDQGLLILEAANDGVDWALARQLVDGELPEVVLVNQVLRGSGPREPEQAAPVPSFQSQPPQAALPALPRIAAVVGGARPFLLLEQGQKWLPGGQIGGVTLQAVEDQSLVFEDAQGRTWRRPR